MNGTSPDLLDLHVDETLQLFCGIASAVVVCVALRISRQGLIVCPRIGWNMVGRLLVRRLLVGRLLVRRLLVRRPLVGWLLVEWFFFMQYLVRRPVIVRSIVMELDISNHFRGHAGGAGPLHGVIKTLVVGFRRGLPPLVDEVQEIEIARFRGIRCQKEVEVRAGVRHKRITGL